MIKQIQLRGISRTPSDRGTMDGGCAESINVHLDEQETAPNVPAKDISEEIYRQATDKYPIVFVHKMTGVENYIGCLGVNLRAYGSTLDATGESLNGRHLDTGETLRHVTSLGNTLIIYSDVKPYYFLFKDGAYKFLGNSIPAPQIEVVSVPYIGNLQSPYLVDVDMPDLPTSLRSFSREEDAVAAWRTAVNGGNHYSDLLSFMDDFWSAVVNKTSDLRNDGLFYAPFFLRYAVKTYDGSYIHTSVPILCQTQNYNRDEQPWIKASLTRDTSQTLNYNLLAKCKLTNVFQVRIKMAAYDASDWSDIIESIDLFASTPIFAPLFDTGIEATKDGTEDNIDLVFETMGDDKREKTIRSEVMSKGQFYKIASYEISNSEDMSNLTSGEEVIKASDDIVMGENLATKETLEEGYRTSSQYIPANGAMNLNSRVLLVGATETLPTGSAFLNGLAIPITNGSPDDNPYAYVIQYKIDGGVSGLSTYFRGVYYGGGNNIRPGHVVLKSVRDGYEWTKQLFADETYTPGQGEMVRCAMPFSWIAFPDTRCRKAELFKFEYNDSRDDWEWIGKKDITLDPHPYLNCACAFLGIDASWDEHMVAPPSGSTTPTYKTENRTLPAKNKLFLSNFENPFLFDASGIITFNDDVVGAAMTSVPLSEGQLGQFDVYVFTKGGIRTLSLNSQGEFIARSAQPSLSQHIALPGTITALDQAVVFTTTRGVMLLQGHQVTDLSANMIGRPFVLSDEVDQQTVETLVESETWGDLAAISNIGDSFMAFMEGACPAYDSNGNRLVFFNSARSYQYVYMLKKGTWHKMFRSFYHPFEVLNSYPRLLVSQYYSDTSEEDEEATVYDFSTVLDDASLLAPVNGVDNRTPVPGFIVTRPFDLDASDRRKSIRSIRIRGRYNRGDVRYILQGSMDGWTWVRLTSLKGASYKLFRMILLTSLTPDERISWIDIDFETRFTNRLR